MFTQKFKYLPFVMWFFPLVFFAYQFILRLWPGLMMPQMMTQFSIDASHFGLIAAFYYYGYSSMQIPAALLLDRFGARYIVGFFAIVCGVATLLFTYTNNWYLACLTRFLVGVGSAAGFLGVSKVVSEWFPKNQYTRMIGFSFTIGLMGAIYGGKPLSLLIEMYHWQKVALALALVSIGVGCSTYFVLRSPTHKKEKMAPESFKLSSFKTLLSSPVIWLLALANLLMVGSLEGFSDAWGVPYLMTAYSISKNDAAQLISFVFFGMLFGGPVLAFCSKQLSHYTLVALCGFGMAGLFAALLMQENYHWWFLASLFFSLGLLCCYQVLVFAAGSALVKTEQLGITIAFLNCINMLGGSFFHTVIGKVMDLYWSGLLSSEHIKLYSLLAYQRALMLIPICAILGALIVCLLGLKSSRQQELSGSALYTS